MNEIEPKQVVNPDPAAVEAPTSTANGAESVTVPDSKRRPKSQLRLQLEALGPGQEITVGYVDMKTPFSVLIAIKRQQLGKHYVFEEIETGKFKVRIGVGTDRSHSLRKKA
jgi:hypothetical protein